MSRVSKKENEENEGENGQAKQPAAKSRYAEFKVVRSPTPKKAAENLACSVGGFEILLPSESERVLLELPTLRQTQHAGPSGSQLNMGAEGQLNPTAQALLLEAVEDEEPPIEKDAPIEAGFEFVQIPEAEQSPDKSLDDWEEI